jgi:hypothetical protein
MHVCMYMYVCVSVYVCVCVLKRMHVCVYVYTSQNNGHAVVMLAGKSVHQ